MSQSDRISLLLLPGLLCDETMWRPQTTGLAPICRPEVITYPDATTIGEMARIVLDRAPARFALAGHSMGGRVALDVLAELERRGETERLKGIALLDTAAGPAAATEAAKRRPLVDRAWAQGMAVLVEDWLPPMVHPARLSDAALMQALADMVLRRTPQQFAGQVKALLTRPDARPVLRRIACPALILCGRQDAWRTVEEHAAMADLVPGCVFDVVEDCGHMATVEQPEAVNASLARWLKRVFGAGNAA